MTSNDPLRPFTSKDARTMTPDQITAFWVARQEALKAQGAEHYTRLVDAGTGALIASL